MSKIFSCKHDNRKSLVIEYFGVEKNIEICKEDEEYMKLLPDVKILEVV